MTSESAFVWMTLPGDTGPTLVGHLTVDENGGTFLYRRSYRLSDGALPIDPSELPLAQARHDVGPDRNGGLPGVIRDASPDSWGRYALGAHRDGGLSEVTLLLRSPDDRVGALSFSSERETPPTSRPPAPTVEALEALAEASLRQRTEQGPRSPSDPGPSPRTRAFVGDPTTSLGGARPKITVLEEDALWLAKINKQDDAFDFARAEAAMLDLARMCGIEVPDATVRRFDRHDALLVRRFDRHVTPNGGVERIRFASALTCLRADEGDRGARSYLSLADEVRRVGRPDDGPELFRRMVLNALIGNGDDHLRNHGMIATDTGWRLSPAYDLVPHPTHSHEMRLALDVGEDGDRIVTVPRMVDHAGRFGLSSDEARSTVAAMAEIVAGRWHVVLRARGMNDTQIAHLRTSFLNPGLRLGGTGRPPPTLSKFGD